MQINKNPIRERINTLSKENKKSPGIWEKIRLEDILLSKILGGYPMAFQGVGHTLNAFKYLRQGLNE